MANTDQESILGASLELTAALQEVERICNDKTTEVSYQTMQRSGFRRPNWRRAITLADARSYANTARIHLRVAWELLDPISPAKHAAAKRTALGNSQEQLRIAIGHLQAVLNKARTFDEQQKADTAARDWLTSIGSEPE